jgi:putative hydrolase of the HAD superfamily
VLFDLALGPFRVAKEDAVFVGDSLVNDIQGAKGFGMAAVWINPSGATSAAADYVISDLTEL